MNLCASCGKEIAEGTGLYPECEEKITKKEVGT